MYTFQPLLVRDAREREKVRGRERGVGGEKGEEEEKEEGGKRKEKSVGGAGSTA